MLVFEKRKLVLGFWPQQPVYKKQVHGQVSFNSELKINLISESSQVSVDRHLSQIDRKEGRKRENRILDRI
jgi:hypothetical protein